MPCPPATDPTPEWAVLPAPLVTVPDRYDVVCITGGAGYFGQAMARHLLATTTDTVIRCIDQDEWGLKQAASACGHDPRLRWVLGNVRDHTRLHLALSGADVVIHAAALKHVDVCERSASECVATNVMGSQHVAQAAIYAGVKRAVFLSSDKAVAPTTVYGASKLLAEKTWIQHNAYSPEGTAFLAVRYGNVAGSRGSVLDVCAARLRDKAPFYLTAPEASRFWMHAWEAVALVDWVMATGPRGGVFVPELPAFTIGDLLEAIGDYLTHSVPYEVTGLRPAEKLHEQLLLEEERRGASWALLPTADLMVTRLAPAYPTWPEEVTGWAVSSKILPVSHYDSGTTPWRLTVADLVENLMAMDWLGEARC